MEVKMVDQLFGNTERNYVIAMFGIKEYKNMAIDISRMQMQTQLLNIIEMRG